MVDPIIDTWTQADDEPWDPAIWTTIRNARGTSSPPSVQAGAGRMVTDGSPPDNCRIICSPTTEYADVGIVVAIRTTDAHTIEIGFRVGEGIDSGEPTSGYVLQLLPVYGIYKIMTINAYDFVGQKYDDPQNDGVWRKYRIYSRGTRHRAKWWLATDPEPPFWDIDVIDTTYSTGRVFLGMWNNDGFSPPPVTVEWDDFRVDEVVPPPPGIYAPNALIVGLYAGDAPVITAYQGSHVVDVP